MKDETVDIDVAISVDGVELDAQQSLVIDTYKDNIETFIQKNRDYGGSFENSAKLDSILRYGEVREDALFDIIAEQILVRGFYDKLSRFHQLQIQDNGGSVSGETIEDTLLDMGNYAIMLAAMRRKYDDDETASPDPFEFANEGGWDAETVQEFMNEFDPDSVNPDTVEFDSEGIDRDSTIAE